MIFSRLSSLPFLHSRPWLALSGLGLLFCAAALFTLYMSFGAALSRQINQAQPGALAQLMRQSEQGQLSAQAPSKTFMGCFEWSGFSEDSFKKAKSALLASPMAARASLSERGLPAYWAVFAPSRNPDEQRDTASASARLGIFPDAVSSFPLAQNAPALIFAKTSSRMGAQDVSDFLVSKDINDILIDKMPSSVARSFFLAPLRSDTAALQAVLASAPGASVRLIECAPELGISLPPSDPR